MWTSTGLNREEHLPPENTRLLLYWENETPHGVKAKVGTLYSGFYEAGRGDILGGWYIYGVDGAYGAMRPTHWMLSPEPPDRKN